MAALGVWTARIGYRDREDTVAHLVLYFGTAVDPGELLAWLSSDSRFQAISNNAVCSVEVQRTTIETLVFPTAQTVLRWGTLVFATDEPDGYGLLDIPGCRALTLETGCFAGRAFDLTQSALIDLAELVVSAPALITPDLSPYNLLCGGGLRDVWQALRRRSG